MKKQVRTWGLGEDALFIENPLLACSLPLGNLDTIESPEAVFTDCGKVSRRSQLMLGNFPIKFLKKKWPPSKLDQAVGRTLDILD